MALQGKVFLLKYKSLMGSTGVAEQVGRFCRQIERFAMPVKTDEVLCFSEPVFCLDGIAYLNGTPADFLDGVGAYGGTECLGDELSAQAMAEHGDVMRNGGANEVQAVSYPG